jgi:hypothetical protein
MSRPVVIHQQGDRPHVNSLNAVQQSRNRESDDAWELYEPHRNRVTSLILDALPAGDANRVCLLGPGNCNDVDLSALAERCTDILLVDLDAEAMDRGITRQGLREHSAVQQLSGLDLTGVFGDLESYAPGSPGVNSLVQTANKYSPTELTGGFDVAVSLCLLSQLVDSILQTIEDPQAAMELTQAIRQRHLRLLLEQCRPSGRAVLISEVVSSDTAPELPEIDDARLPAFLGGLLTAGNFFTGLHPGVIHQELVTDPALVALASDVQVAAPWKWPFLYRTYAVTAFTIGRRPEDA